MRRPAGNKHMATVTEFSKTRKMEYQLRYLNVAVTMIAFGVIAGLILFGTLLHNLSKNKEAMNAGVKMQQRLESLVHVANDTLMYYRGRLPQGQDEITLRNVLDILSNTDALLEHAQRTKIVSNVGRVLLETPSNFTETLASLAVSLQNVIAEIQKDKTVRELTRLAASASSVTDDVKNIKQLTLSWRTTDDED